jgi:isoaspartyl peptidase/L-asparaginase-like protein (Ntn-hydrolase superfamily)
MRRMHAVKSAPLLLAAILASACAAPRSSEQATGSLPVAIATWPFGKVGTDRAMQELRAGASPLDAVEQGVRAVEKLSPDGSVGLGGRPNAAGYVQLDACIMDGKTCGAGSVAGLEGIVHPISAARRVMEDTKHVMLVGEGARWFALSKGLETVDVSALDAQKKAWQEKATSAKEPSGHDTVTLLALAQNGDLAGGCSTSGMADKLPGRVGDSPILGAGLYVDNEVGAAGATGVGENVMRHCTTYAIVERMRQGMDPQTACEETLHAIAKKDPRGYRLNFCVLAVDKQGRVGAATTDEPFPYAVTTATGSEVRTAQPIRAR